MLMGPGRVGKQSLLGGILQPSAELNFMAGAVDPRITFTRAAGSQSVTGSDGLIVVPGTNVARFDYDASTARYNYLTISEAINSWTKVDDTVTDNNVNSPTGFLSASRVVEGVAGTALLTSNAVSVTPSQLVTGSVYLKRSNQDIVRVIMGDAAFSNGAQAWINLATGAVLSSSLIGTATGQSATITDAGNGWYRVTVSCTLAAGSTVANLGICSATANASGVRQSSSAYFVWGGQIELVGAATAYIATTASIVGTDATPKGLLIEEARTNLLLQSGDFSNAAWTPSSVGVGLPVVTANIARAPDGTVTAARIVLAGTPGPGTSCTVLQNITGTAAVYSNSVYLRGAAGGEVVYLSMTPDGVTYYSASATLTKAWQRFTLVTGALTAVAWAWQIGRDRRDGTQTGSASQTIYAWGGQCELGPFVTSYIPTTAASATRAAESATMPTGSWFNAAQGTLAVEFMQSPLITTVTFCDMPSLQTDGSNLLLNRIGGSGTTISTTAFVANVNVGGVAPAGAPVGGVAQRFATTYVAATNVLTMAFNGGAVASGTPSSLPAINQIFIGNARSGSPNAFIRRIRYWPRVLSSPELIAATA